MQSSSAASLTLKEKLTQQRLGFEYERLVAAEQRAERALKSITLSLDSENQRLKNYLATQSKNNITEDQLAKKNDIYYNGRKKAIEREETKLTAAQQALELAKTAREAFAKENPWVLDIKPKTATVTQTPLTLFDFVDPAKITTVKFLGPHSSNTSTLTRVSTPSISPSTVPSADPVDPLLNTSRGGTLSQTSATPLPASSSIHRSSPTPSSSSSSTPLPSPVIKTQLDPQQLFISTFGTTPDNFISALQSLRINQYREAQSHFLTKVRQMTPDDRLTVSEHIQAIAVAFDAQRTKSAIYFSPVVAEATEARDEVNTSLSIARLATEQLPNVTIPDYRPDEIDRVLHQIRELSRRDEDGAIKAFLTRVQQLAPVDRLAVSEHIQAIAAAFDARTTALSRCVSLVPVESTKARDEVNTSLSIARLATEQLPHVTIPDYRPDEIDRILHQARELSWRQKDSAIETFLLRVQQLAPVDRLAVSAHVQAIAVALDAQTTTLARRLLLVPVEVTKARDGVQKLIAEAQDAAPTTSSRSMVR